MRWLNIRPHEARVATRLFGLMLVVFAGAAVGSSGVESLLFARFGPGVLPVLYIVVGPATLAVMVAMSMLLARLEPLRLLSRVPLALAVVLGCSRLALELDLRWLFPVLWVVMMAVWTVQALTLWGVAGAVHHTREAKRLFPLYGAGVVLGSAIGGLATRPLAVWLHAENLLLVWVVALVMGSFLARTATRSYGGALRIKRSAAPGRPLQEEMGDGLRFVRGSPLLRSMAAAVALLAALYFTLTLPFARAATARFADPDRLAGFLGMFFGLVNGTALVASLLVTNRLFARLGIPTMVLVLPLIYFVGFDLLVVDASFAALVGFRFLQMVWVNAVWAPGWQALFNVVPAERRGQIRTFMDGGPLQAGTVAAGVLLIATEHVLPDRGLFLVAAAVAAAATLFTWRTRRAYRRAVVDALRAGWPEVFIAEERPFGGSHRDAVALRALLRGTRNPDPRLRRVALEILAEVEGAEAEAALVAAARDQDPKAREVVLRALARRRIPALVDQIVPSLVDLDPPVRGWAVEALASCRADGAVLAGHLAPLLDDPDPVVRARAAAGITAHAASAPAEVADSARDTLAAMASDLRPSWRAAAMGALDGRAGVHPELAAAGLSDPEPSVRRAAASALGRIGGLQAPGLLISALGDEDASVGRMAGEALASMADGVASRLVEALTDPRLEARALDALRGLPGPAPPALREYASRQGGLALRYHSAWAALGDRSDDRLDLLADSLRQRAIGHALNALRALPSFDDREALDLAVDSLASRDPQQVANALEALESARDNQVARTLLTLWEGSSRPAGDAAAAVEAALSDEDPWLRAAAALAIRASAGVERSRLESMGRLDPDPLVRETIEWTLGGGAMETVTTLPVMERVLFLRKVPLFAGLAPADLKHVAEVAVERVYPDATVIAQAGEAGMEMHVVVSGEIRVVVERDSGHLEIATRRPGEHVGEMAIITDEPRMASLIAAGTVRTLSIDQKRFERILLERPEASLAVMRELCDRLRAAGLSSPAASQETASR